MIDFISDNFILCITAVYVLLGMIMSIKLKNSDMKIVDKYGKSFAEIPFRIRHRILLNGKWIKIQCAITVVLIYAVMLVRLNKIFSLPLAVLVSLPASLLLALVFSIHCWILHLDFLRIHIHVLFLEFFFLKEKTFCQVLR